MLIRFVVDNVFSFGQQKEFSTIANSRLKTLADHKYSYDSVEILKLCSIYGANGAGKSNLIKALHFLEHFVRGEELPFSHRETLFKFNPERKKQLYAIEFIEGSTPYYYAIEVESGIVVTEELYKSGLGAKDDELIYVRKTDNNKQTSIKFLEAFENDEKSQVLKSVLLEEFVEPTKPILKFLSKRDNKFLSDVKNAYEWFNNTLQIITPNSRPEALAEKIESNESFRKYAEEMMCSFNIGITGLTTSRTEVKEFFGEDQHEFIEELTKKLDDKPDKLLILSSSEGEQVVIMEEDGKHWVKQLQIEHKAKNEKIATFDLDEESDGTIRLLDFVPAFQDIITKEKVYLVDEIERSIHPLLIKELITKFSHDPKTKGQLIFTTHESNLLHQDIFRQDEIWFAEKDNNGCTDLYSLNDFKEHKTIDIQKGYLSGRYGSIPFLGSLTDLNWHKYDTSK